MKINEFAFDESIIDQINEIDSIVLLKGYSETQAYAYYQLSIPKSLRQLLAPNEQQKQEIGPLNAIKNNIVMYANKNANPEKAWNGFLNEHITVGENVREYCNRLISMIKLARPNMLMEDIMFFLKPKLLELVNDQVRPLVMCQVYDDIPKLVDVIQMVRNSEKQAMYASTNATDHNSKSDKTCFKCGGYNHVAKDCRGLIKCSRCNKRGHVARLCKSKLASHSVNQMNIDDEPNYYPACFSRISNYKNISIDSQFNYKLTFDILRQSITALADTGSGYSLLSKRVISNVPIKPSSIKLVAANGSTIDVIGEISTSVILFGRKKIHNFVVISELIYDCIIGRDFLTSFGFVLKPESSSNTSCSVKSNQTTIDKFKRKFRNIFENSDDIKSRALPNMKIRTSEDSVFIAPRQQPFALRVEIEKQTKEMLKNGIIRESESPFNSPVILVKKKKNGYRFCVDFRKLNSVTHKEQFPMPYTSDAPSKMIGSTIFSTIDLKQGYWQLELDEDSKSKTAFSTHQGHYEFNRIPFGLVNAPGFFQRTINKLFIQHIGIFCYVYLDDIIVFSKNIDDHLMHLEKIFSILSLHNLKINIEKCSFFSEKVSYLGHLITKQGVGTDPEKTRCISKYPVPINQKTLRSFLGLANYYRDHIKGFSLTAAPLYLLCKKNSKFKWENNHQEAFEKLKEKLGSPPLLSFPDMSVTFTVTTDASNVGVGAVLSQSQSNKHVVIQYASKCLNNQQEKYSAYEKEAYAIVFALKNFRKYLIGNKFTIVTDHNPLKYIMNSKDSHGRIARWLLLLQEYDFDIIHKKGALNIDADCLSRIPSSDICSLTTERDLIKEIVCNQKQDDSAKRIMDCIKNSKSHAKYMVDDGVLYRKLNLEDQQLLQLFVPIKCRKRVIDESHEASGHSGYFKTFSHVRNKFYWPGYELETKEFVKSCSNCQIYGEKKGRAPLIPIRSKGPLDIVEIDIIGPLNSTRNGNRYAICIVDVFSKIAQAIPIPDLTASTTARALLDNFIYIYGSPNRIHSDNGRNFTSQLLKDVLNILSIKQSFTTPYHPEGNGSVERFNKTIKLMIVKTSHEEDWDDALPLLVYKYNCNVHSSTNLSPYQIIFGRYPKLFSVTNDKNNDLETPSPYSYVQHLKNTLGKLKISTKSKLRKSQRKYKSDAEGSVLLKVIKPGCKVLYKISNEKKWSGPYTVVSKDSPVNYTIEDTNSRFRVHRNNMKIFFTPYGGKECNSSYHDIPHGIV